MNKSPIAAQRGASLVEVLVTILLLAFGLLGIAAFQSKAQVGTIESYQRAQAIVLLEDMQARINSNAAMANAYSGANVYGVGDTQSDCAAKAAGAARDTCEWSLMLRGSAETKGSTQTGAMAGARGCIEEVQARDATEGVCKPGIYRISVAWQGNHETAAPSLACGKDQYGSEKLRRAISVRVLVATPECRFS